MNSGKKTTIDSLARNLGVSASTVSRALNGYDDISENTQRRIREAANEAGYQMASERKSKRRRTNTVGMVVERLNLDISGPFLAKFLRGATEALSKDGVDLLVASADGPAEELNTYQRLITDRKVDGFILTRLRTEDPRIALLTENKVPFVVHGRDAAPEDYSWLDIDAAGAMDAALEHLVAFGHRRIGLIQGPEAVNYVRLRFDAYQSSVKRLGLESDDKLVVGGGLTPEDGARAAKAIMCGDAPPTALVCDLDNLAIGAMAALRQLGLQPGSDVSVIGYGDDPFAAYAVPPLTTFNQKAQDAGKWVAEMMLARLDGVSPQILQRLNSASIIPRESVTQRAHTSQRLAELVTEFERRTQGGNQT